jgi:creatinine amidohydrolase
MDERRARAAAEWRYEKLTWEEINEAVALGKVCILPCGSVEQHGPHLPLDVDIVCPTGIARGAGAAASGDLLVLPTVNYGYMGHVMDFPGTVNVDFEHYIHMVLDLTKSLAYHGFKKVILLNGHGSNMPNLDLVSRRHNLETDGECLLVAWWDLLKADPEFLPSWRESRYPGGCSHACELETSLYLYLDEENVRKDRVRTEFASYNLEGSPFLWNDLLGRSPAALISWTSSYSRTGVIGDPEKATREKGRLAYEEAVRQLVALARWFRRRPRDPRETKHSIPPTIPMPWGQQPAP